jgi:MFS family permease
LISSKIPKRILPTIIFAQFAGTSLWFAGNAILKDLQVDWQLPSDALASITSAVQLGFILGTFLFALLSIADRFKPSKVFFVSALVGALLNVSITIIPPSYFLLLTTRFLTGFFLAGIYPVGMKIASDWYGGKLGKALGYLVGALVIGTALPHLINYFGAQLSWTFVLKTTSLLALIGGLAMLFLVDDGPFRKTSSKFSPQQIKVIFKEKSFRSGAFGYFGHMWELYTFWAFVPVILHFYNVSQNQHIDVSLWSFIIIGAGAIASAIGGFYSIKFGSAKSAFIFLLISGVCCLLSPLFFELPPYLFLSIMTLWGFAVVGDSAQFSSLNAQTAPPELIGTALTIVVSIGFLITIPSLQLLSYLDNLLKTKWIFLVLVIGPVFGLVSTQFLLKKK